MKAIVCDKCKKVMTDEKELKDTLRLDLCTNYLSKFSEKHLCNDCKDLFCDWIDNEQVV